MCDKDIRGEFNDLSSVSSDRLNLSCSDLFIFMY